MFVDVVCPILFRLTIVLSVLRYTDSDYPCGIFKLFFNMDTPRKWLSKYWCFCIKTGRFPFMMLTAVNKERKPI
jgi:hypothetical protein